jgi:membrane-bound ClpP family serine protease
MNRRLTLARLVLAIVSTGAEETLIWGIWRWLLPEFGVELHYGVLIGAMVAWAIFSIWLFVFTSFALKKQVLVGLPSMVGTKGKAASKLTPEGMVRIKGELWGARSDRGDINIGEGVVVIGEDGLKLLVRKVGDRGTTH